jgi:hypothetical protein
MGRSTSVTVALVIIGVLVGVSGDGQAPSTAAQHTGHIIYVGQQGSYLHRLLEEAGLRVVHSDIVPALEALQDTKCLVIDDDAGPTVGDGTTVEMFLHGGGGVCLVGASVLRLGGARESAVRADVKPISGWLGVAEFYDETYEYESAVVLVERPFGTPLRAGEHLYARPGGFRCLIAGSPGAGKRFEEIVGLPRGLGSHNVAGFANRYEQGRIYWQAICPDDPNYPQAERLFVAAVQWASSRALPVPEATEVAYVGHHGSYLHRLLQAEGLGPAQTDSLPVERELQHVNCLVIDDVVGLTTDGGETVRGFLRAGKGVCLVGRAALSLAGARQPGWGLTARVGPIADWLGVGDFRMTEAESAEVLVDRPFGTLFRAGQRIYTRPGGLTCLYVGYDPGELMEPIMGSPWGFGNYSVIAFSSKYGEGRVYWQAFCPDDPNYPEAGRLFVSAVRWAGKLTSPPRQDR